MHPGSEVKRENTESLAGESGEQTNGAVEEKCSEEESFPREEVLQNSHRRHVGIGGVLDEALCIENRGEDDFQYRRDDGAAKQIGTGASLQRTPIVRRQEREQKREEKIHCGNPRRRMSEKNDTPGQKRCPTTGKNQPERCERASNH